MFVTVATLQLSLVTGVPKATPVAVQLALAETRMLLDKLFRIPGVRLVRAPDMQWTPPMLQSYQLVNAVIACDKG